MDEEMDEERKGELKKIMGETIDNLKDSVEEYYPTVTGEAKVGLLKKLLGWVSWSMWIGHPFLSKGQTPMDLAVSLVSTCVRNNTSLEDYHCQGIPIGDAEMEILMKEFTANVADWFVIGEVLGKQADVEEVPDLYRAFVSAGMRWAWGWELDRAKLPLG